MKHVRNLHPPVWQRVFVWCCFAAITLVMATWGYSAFFVSHIQLSATTPQTHLYQNIAQIEAIDTPIDYQVIIAPGHSHVVNSVVDQLGDHLQTVEYGTIAPGEIHRFEQFDTVDGTWLLQIAATMESTEATIMHPVHPLFTGILTILIVLFSILTAYNLSTI